MYKQILQALREIAADQGYDPEEVYIIGEKIVMPITLAEKVLAAIEALKERKPCSFQESNSF